MSGDLSVVTVLVSALVSIATGYVGSLLSAGRLRRQEVRVYGLALLAEVKSIYRSLWRYHVRVGRLTETELAALKDARAALGLWRRDLSVFTANSGKIGLFSARTAVELIEFYHRVRWLESHSSALDATGGNDRALAAWITEQDRAVRLARQHARYLSRLLHGEIPANGGDLVNHMRHGRWRPRRLRPKQAFLGSHP